MNLPLKPSDAVALARMTPRQLARWLAACTPRDLLLLDAAYELWAARGQIEPRRKGWRTWLMMAGRGYGKTRAGAEWVHRLAMTGKRRIALVGATIDEARAIMVEGVSGVMSVARRHGVTLKWSPSRNELTWPSGAVAALFSGENADGLRGYEHDFAWCDELAKWRQPEATWDNLQLGLRHGPRARALVTTTPRPLALLERIRGEKWTVETNGRTSDNINLPADFVEVMIATYGGSALGRQELDGELLGEAEGTLWPRALIERCRAEPPDAYDKIVVGVDPPASGAAGPGKVHRGDACGIVVAGRSEGKMFVLADCTIKGASPERWARAVAQAAEQWNACLVVAAATEASALGVAETIIWAWPQVARDGLTIFGEKQAMESFVDADFPIAIGQEASVSPGFSTNVVTSVSGHEYRNANWSEARLRFDAGPGIRGEQELAELIDFFRARRGRAVGFRFRDPFDHSSAALGGAPSPTDQLLGVGDGARTRFALRKMYGETERGISRPVAGSVRVAIGGAELVSGWTLMAGGNVEFAVAPVAGAVVSAGFLFDVPVRGEVTSLAFCWTLERRDGAGLGLTSHDRALVIGGTRYRPSPGITPAAVLLRAGLEAQRGEVEGALSDAALSERDLEAGRWDGARVSLFAVDWEQPGGEQVKLAGGGLGPVAIKDGGFAAELVGAADALSAPVCPETSPECRAELGDRMCRVDLAGRREMFAVTSFGGGTLGFDRAVEARFQFGEALILDGDNAGWRSRIIAVAANAVVLRDVPLFAVAAGCRVRLTEGCDKRFETCRAHFANSVNFRGEPHLPGNDLLTRYPGA